MGLDMYLNAKRFLMTSGEEESMISNAINKILGLPEIPLKDGHIPWGASGFAQEVKLRSGYWRKANHIHRWFVENVQGGEDDCREYWVSREQLMELRNLCKQVVDEFDVNPNGWVRFASENLPVQEGFFFGSTDYDEDYLDDCRSTIAQIDKALELPDQFDFEYQSSW